ncbi:unnamed protein product, partial [Allacma fusca]
ITGRNSESPILSVDNCTLDYNFFTWN